LHQVAELRKLSVNYSYELMRFVKSLLLSVKGCYRLLSVKNILKSVKDCSIITFDKDCFKSVKRLALRALGGVWWLWRGAFVSKFSTSCTYKRVKRGLIGLVVSVGVVVLCQLAYSPAVLPLYWACTSNTLHGWQSQGYTIPHYTTTLTDPHPLNFSARCYIHPTLTQTTFSSPIRLCTDEQYINNTKEYTNV
jgi:hypothetical protein